MEGTSFGRYRLIELLGRGGMGEVWRAHDTETDRIVAIKLLPPHFSQDEDFQRRFRREAHAAARLNTPHVVPIHNYGEIDGRLYVDMRLIEGRDLAAVLAAGPLTPARAVRIVDGIATALQAAHKVGLLHRDVKPSNILVDENDFAYLIDFGIARAVDETRITKSGNMIGTLAYIAPERLGGNAEAEEDARADVYSLACVLYECLTGHPPFDGATPQLLTAHLHTPPPRPSTSQPAVPESFDAVIAAGMAKDPDQRYATTIELAGAARDAITAPVPRQAGRPRTQARSGPNPAPPTRASQQPATAPQRRSHRQPPAAKAPAGEHWWRRRTVVIPAALVTVAAVAVTAAIVITHRPRENSNTGQVTSPTSAASSPPAAPAAAPACGDGQALLASMSLRDKLAQLLMVGVADSDDARQVVTTQHVGGIIIGSKTDLAMMNDNTIPDIANAGGPLPLAVGVDEEGGRVSRLKSLIGVQPSPRVLAQTNTPQQVHDIAFKRGEAMKKLGITVDFAPVVDVTTESDDEVIGDRSFGSDPATVTEYAGAYAQGLRDAGVLPVLKHFPGHGHGSGDSHLGDVTTPPLDQLQENDLIPYRTLTTVKPVAVMVGHLEVPGLTTDQPSSLTPAVYDLLRSGKYGGPPFDGLVFTDDISSMKAISDHFGVAEAALRALQAGADVALWVTTTEVPAVLDRLEQAVAAGELKPEMVDASVLRVFGVKGPSPNCPR